MGQVTIYLDSETEKAARASALADGVSLSKWVAQRVRKGQRAEWPTVVRDLAGAWRDLPSAEEIRRSSKKDIARTGL